MSVKNGHDRDEHGRIKNYYAPWFVWWHCTYKGGYNIRGPRSWRNLCHIRPCRRANKRTCHALLNGADADAVAYPLAKKPHEYWL